MPSSVNGQVLTTARGNRVNIFDTKNVDKFSRQYLRSLTNNVKGFLNKEKHANASRDDVTRYLQSKGLVDGVIKSNPAFIKLINSNVSENRTGLTLPGKERALKHLRDVTRFDPKYLNKKISRDDILSDLRESGNLTRISKPLEDAIKAIIGRHNAAFTKKDIEKYRKGKNKYSLSFRAVVWNEQQEREYVDDRYIAFFSNLTYEQITDEIVKEIVEMYYADRDYPDFIRLLNWVVKNVTHDKDIKNMTLLDVICGKKYRNNYVRSYKDLVEGYDEQDPKNDGKCLNIMLQTNYKSLVDQRLVPKKKLTNKYIDDFFKEERTINRLLEYVKELKHASIYIFDQIGKELIASYKAKDEHKSVHTTATAVALIGDHHVEFVADANVKRSVANGDQLTIFNTNRCFEEEQFEMFDDAEALAVSFDDECNTEYKEQDADGREKDSKSPVIFLEDKIIGPSIINNLMISVSEKYNVVITNILDDGKYGMPSGFIHPITDQLYLFQESYHERKEMCNILHKYSNNDAFRWKAQSVLQLSSLIAEHLDLVEIKVVKSELSKEDREMYMKNPISQPIARDDDDAAMKKTQGSDCWIQGHLYV